MGATRAWLVAISVVGLTFLPACAAGSQQAASRTTVPAESTAFDEAPTILVAVVDRSAVAPPFGIRIIDITHGTERLVGAAAGGWQAVAWSPDGQHLAAVEQARTPIVHVFRRSDWKDSSAPLPSTVSSLISWAPDSSRFIVVGDPLFEFTPNLATLAIAAGPPPRTPGPNVAGGFAATGWWAPDSKTVATILDGRLFVLWPDGTGEVVAQPPDLISVQPHGWLDARTLVVSGGGPGQASAWSVALARGKSDWQARASVPGTDPGYDAALAALGTGQANTLMSGSLTADSRGAVLVSAPSAAMDDVTAHASTGVMFGSTIVKVDLGPIARRGFFLGGRDYSVVVVGGTAKHMQYEQISSTMSYFVVFAPDLTADRTGFTGAGQTPYDQLDDAVEAAISGKKAAAARGFNQRYSIVEAPTSQDALLFASGAQPPRDVLERMFGDPSHVVTGRMVWTEGDAEPPTR